MRRRSVTISSTRRPSHCTAALRHDPLDAMTDTAIPLDREKFRDPRRTASGKARATVRLDALRTVWFNTGTLCNIECARCYIESSPDNDRLVYITRADVVPYLDEIARDSLPVSEIGFTGGEPFLNPNCCQLIEEALVRGFTALVLTNAMRPMMRPRVQKDLIRLLARFGERLTLRVSLDHYAAALHDKERGANSWESTMKGLRWLSENGFSIAVAGRTFGDEPADAMRRGYGALFARASLSIDAQDPTALVLFPEMDANVDVPEVTVDCWNLLHVNPADMMCATSRMIVKRKEAMHPVVVACTLLPYDPQFELGTTLADASGPITLNHPHCAKFCVLGGGSCSAAS